MYPDLINVKRKFGRSRLRKDFAVIPSVNKEKLSDAEFSINELLNSESLKTSNNLTSSEIILVYINLAQVQFMLGDLDKAKSTLKSISSMEGEAKFRKEVSLAFGSWD